MASLEWSVSVPAQPLMCSFTSVRVFPCLPLCKKRGILQREPQACVGVQLGVPPPDWGTRGPVCSRPWGRMLTELMARTVGSRWRTLRMLALQAPPWPWGHGSDPWGPSSASHAAWGPRDSYSHSTFSNCSWWLGFSSQFNEAHSIFVCEVLPSRGILATYFFSIGPREWIHAV